MMGNALLLASLVKFSYSFVHRTPLHLHAQTPLMRPWKCHGFATFSKRLQSWKPFVLNIYR